MEIYIEKVVSGAEYEGGIFNFWITALLNSGIKINIFDSEGYNLSELVNQKRDCLILAYLIRIIESNDDIKKYEREKVVPSITEIITGTYIEEYSISSKWTRWTKKYSPAIKTADGIFLLSKFDLYNYNFLNGVEITIHVGRFDLLDWLPIKKPN